MVGRNWVVAALAAPLMMLSGCQTTTLKPGAQDQMLRGTLIATGETYWFESCLGGERQPVLAMTDALKASHERQSLGDEWPVYVESLGRQEAEGVMLTQGFLAGGTQRACRFDLPDVELRAVSADEQVVFDLTERHIRVQFIDRLLMLAFERPEVEVEGQVRRWEQSMQGSGESQNTLLLEVRPEACTGKRGDWYGLSMEAELNNRYFSGCARLGDFVHWPLRQRYQTPDSVQTRRIDLSLMADGQLHWREDYMNDQPLLEHEGRWRRLSPSLVQVVLDGQGASDAGMVFRVADDGALKLEGFHPAYGRDLEFESSAGLLRFNSGELDWWQ